MSRLWQYKDILLNDTLAGLTGAIVGVPQAMAFAIIAGVSPVYGLYTVIVSTIAGSLFAKTVRMTIAPTNALALVVGSTLAPFQDGQTVERLFILTFLVGVFQLAFGLLRLGNIARFVSNAVMTGFISGAGVLIMLGQLPNLTGYETSVGGNILLRTWDWLIHPAGWHLPTVLIGVSATLMIAGLFRTRLKQAAPLLAIVLTGVFVALAGWEGVPLVEDIAQIPSGFPRPALPDFRYVPAMAPAALAMAVLGLVQSTGIIQSIQRSQDSNVSQDFVAQGIANLAGSVFQNMPSSGSLSRTAVNIGAGGETRLANIAAGLFGAALLLSFGSLAERIALAALAAQLIVVATGLIDVRAIRRVWRVSFEERLAMGATFASTLVLPLEYSIYIGVTLSLLLYIYTSAQIKVMQLIPLDNHRFREEAVPDILPSNTPIIITVYGNLYFASVRLLARRLPQPDGAERPVVILRLRDNRYLGSSGIQLLERYADQLEARGGKLILAGMQDQIADQLRHTATRLRDENLFFASGVLLSATEEALKYAREWLESRPV